MTIKYIYLNNFRGIKDTEMRLSDVNFLVGENSTGKTSVLSLVSLMYSFEFWINGEYRNKDFDYSYFGDVYGEGYNKKGAVTTVAIVYQNEEDKELTGSIVFTLSGIDGKTKISKIRFIGSKNDTLIDLSKEKIVNKIRRRSIKELHQIKKWIYDDDFTDVKEVLMQEEEVMAALKRDAPYFLISNTIEVGQRDEIISITNIMDHGKRWIAPIRAKPRKTYDDEVYEMTSEGEETPYILRELIDGSKNKRKVIEAIEAFGKESGLFDGIETKSYSKDSNAPFTLNVLINNKSRRITNVGYGVAQVLPVVTDILRFSNRITYFIQQPEVHLHPRAQASLGELVYYAAQSGKSFMIETHSDYLIDRFRQRISKEHKKENNDNFSSQIIYFERNNDGNTLSSIDILPNGRFSEEQPESFKSFFIKEEMNNLKI